MKYLFTVFLLALFIAGYCQTDSLEIKLQQYKKLYDKGLITQAEYESLKARELQLDVPAKNANETIATEPPVQKSDNVNIRVGPVAFGDIDNKVSPRQYTNSFMLGNLAGVGINVQVGANIKRRYFPNVSLGLEGNKKRILVPVGVNFNMNILKGKVSPHFHAGLGYLYLLFQQTGNPNNGHNGMYAGAGFGFSVYVSKRIFLVFSPDYRFLYYVETADDVPKSFQSYNDTRFYYNSIHQLGGRIQVVFM